MITDTKFLDLIRGALMEPPIIVEPEIYIPHAAPIIENARAKAIPRNPNIYGFMFSKTSTQLELQDPVHAIVSN